MIICKICAEANKLTDKPLKGMFQCDSCGSIGKNACYEVETMTELQLARAKKALSKYMTDLITRAYEAKDRNGM